MRRYCQLAGGGGILCRHAHSLLNIDASLVYTLLHDVPNLVFHWVQVGDVYQIMSDEIGSLALHQLNGVMGVVDRRVIGVC